VASGQIVRVHLFCANGLSCNSTCSFQYVDAKQRSRFPFRHRRFHRIAVYICDLRFDICSDRVLDLQLGGQSRWGIGSIGDGKGGGLIAVPRWLSCPGAYRVKTE